MIVTPSAFQARLSIFVQNAFHRRAGKSGFSRIAPPFGRPGLHAENGASLHLRLRALVRFPGSVVCRQNREREGTSTQKCVRGMEIIPKIIRRIARSAAPAMFAPY